MKRERKRCPWCRRTVLISDAKLKVSHELPACPQWQKMMEMYERSGAATPTVEVLEIPEDVQ
jgi:hypothetical protein